MVYHIPQLIQNLSDFLHEESSHHIFLVHGKHSYVASGAAEALKPLLQKYEVTEFTDFSFNPKYEDALKGVDSHTTLLQYLGTAYSLAMATKPTSR